MKDCDKNNIPNLNNQKYKVKECFVQCGIHKYNAPESKTYTCKFKQKGRFVYSIDGQGRVCLGVWHKTTNGWQLYFSIDKPDNDSFIYTPTKVSQNNHVLEMDGINIELGTSKGGLLNVVNAIYKSLPSNLQKNMNNMYNNVNSLLRKNTDQNLGVSHMTCKRID